MTEAKLNELLRLDTMTGPSRAFMAAARPQKALLPSTTNLEAVDPVWPDLLAGKRSFRQETAGSAAGAPGNAEVTLLRGLPFRDARFEAWRKRSAHAIGIVELLILFAGSLDADDVHHAQIFVF